MQSTSLLEFSSLSLLSNKNKKNDASGLKYLHLINYISEVLYDR